MPKNKYSSGGITSVLSPDMRCYQEAAAAGKTSTISVKAGSPFKFMVTPNLFHPGPTLFYMAKTPAGKDVATWEPSGDVWFKVAELAPTPKPEGGLKWQSESRTPLLGQINRHANVNPKTDGNSVGFQLPSSLPSGEYLLRVEHIALHGASKLNGAQMYVACAQIKVLGSGSGNIDKAVKVAFPGAYKAEDPGIKFNLYSPPPKSYPMPGPPVWKG